MDETRLLNDFSDLFLKEKAKRQRLVKELADRVDGCIKNFIASAEERVLKL